MEHVETDGKEASRCLFTCRISRETSAFLTRLPGSNGRKIDRLVTVVRTMSTLLPEFKKDK